MRRPSKIKTGSALVAFLLSFAIAVPVWSDTLILRTGTTLSGTLTDANTSTIMFTDRRGYAHRYSADEVEAVQFGDAPYHSDKAPDQDNHRLMIITKSPETTITRLTETKTAVPTIRPVWSE